MAILSACFLQHVEKRKRKENIGMDLYIWNLSTLNSFPGLFLVSACHLGEDLQSDLNTEVVSVSFVLTWDAKISID